MPVFDANEENTISSDMSCNLLAAHLEKDIQYNEDPNWNGEFLMWRGLFDFQAIALKSTKFEIKIIFLFHV